MHFVHKEIVCLLGRPRVGKSPLATMMQLIGYRLVGAGRLCRKHIRNKTSIGLHIADAVNAGGLVPDDLISEMVLSELKKHDCKIVLDGFPRSIAQAQTIMDYSIANGYALRGIHIDFPPVVSSAVMKICGFIAYRTDDTSRYAKTRLQTYEEKVAPCIGFLTHSGVPISRIGLPKPTPINVCANLGRQSGIFR